MPQLELKTLSQRLRDKLDRAVLPGRLFLDERQMLEVIEALDQNTLNEVTLAAVVFGDDTAGKDWRAIIDHIRRDRQYIEQLQQVSNLLANLPGVSLLDKCRSAAELYAERETESLAE